MTVHRMPSIPDKLKKPKERDPNLRTVAERIRQKIKYSRAAVDKIGKKLAE